MLAELGLPIWVLRVFATLFGLLWGSFLNVVIYRVPREMSVVRPASRCPGCGTPIKAYNNIPVLSFLILGGKTPCCGTKMNPRYVIVELLGGVLALACTYHVQRLMGDAAPWKVVVVFLAEMGLCLSLTAAAFIDAEWMILPDEITIGGGIVGLITATLRGLPIVEALAAGAGVFFIIWFGFNVLYRMIRGRAGMGMGDAKLLALAGAWFGVKGVLFVLLAGSVQGAVGSLLLHLILGKIEVPEAVKQEIAELKKLADEGDEEAKRELELDPVAQEREGFMQAAIPFGPFLILAIFEFLFFEPQIVGWYERHFAL